MDHTFWNKPPVSNVGNNPFTGTVTGTVVDNAPANDTLFIAAGSELYTTATPKLIGTLLTSGVGGKLDWGGHMVLGPPNTYTQGRIAQNGTNYNNINGSLTIVPEPASVTLAIISLAGVGFLARHRRTYRRNTAIHSPRGLQNRAASSSVTSSWQIASPPCQTFLGEPRCCCRHSSCPATESCVVIPRAHSLHRLHARHAPPTHHNSPARHRRGLPQLSTVLPVPSCSTAHDNITV